MAEEQAAPQRPDRCETCRFWQAVQGDKGECRHGPPSTGLILFPPVYADCWCGQWCPHPAGRDQGT